MDLSKLIFKPIFAQVAHPLGDLRGSGNIGLETGPFSSAGAMLNTILSNLLGILTIFAGIWFLIQIVDLNPRYGTILHLKQQ